MIASASAPAVLLLDAAGSDALALLVAAHRHGVEMHAVTDDATYSTYDRTRRALLAGCLLTDLADPVSAATAVDDYGTQHHLCGVLTFTEYLTPLVALIAHRLQLPGNVPALAPSARDKLVMGEQFHRAGVTAPRTVMVDNETDITVVIKDAEIVLPIVVKPSDGAGSAGVSIVHTLDEAAVAYRHATAATAVRPYRSASRGGVLVQEHITGDEYSVESITQDGRVTHLAVTRKTVSTTGAHRVELGHSLPAAIAPGQRASILAEVSKAIAAVGIRNSASHTEVIVDAHQRISVLEVAARLGSGYIGSMIGHALGIDVYRACLDIARGIPADLQPRRHRAAATRFLVAPADGQLAAVHNLPDRDDAVVGMHVRRRVGDPVSAPRANADRIGHLIVLGDEPTWVDEHADRLVRGVRVDVLASL